MKKQQPITIFFVDDNELNCELYQQYLKMYGFDNIVCFKTLDDAKNQLIKKPEILVIDNPYDIKETMLQVEKIKKDNLDLYVILLLPIINDGIVKKALIIGIYECIVKGNDDLLNLKRILEKIKQTIVVLQSKIN